MTQGVLFPLRVLHHLPRPGAGADLQVSALAEDQMQYALKRQAEHPMLPASEWFCYRLAQACALATPFDALLVDLDGAPVFGSRLEAGLTDFSALAPGEQMLVLQDCADRMSACLALDLLVGNEDRHLANFLYRQRADGGFAPFVIDWSRAWWVRGWPPQQLIGTSCNTTVSIGLLRGLQLWRPPSALLTLGTAGAIPSAVIERWLGELPEAWLDPAQRSALLAWWAHQLPHRISDCIAYCQ